MLRNIPIFAIALTAGVAAIMLSGKKPATAVQAAGGPKLETDAWFV